MLKTGTRGADSAIGEIFFRPFLCILGDYILMVNFLIITYSFWGLTVALIFELSVAERGAPNVGVGGKTCSLVVSSSLEYYCYKSNRCCEHENGKVRKGFC